MRCWERSSLSDMSGDECVGRGVRDSESAIEYGGRLERRAHGRVSTRSTCNTTGTEDALLTRYEHARSLSRGGSWFVDPYFREVDLIL